MTAPLVPLFGDTAAARGLARGLDPQLAALLTLQEQLRVPALESMPVRRARAFAARSLAAFEPPAPRMAEVIDTAIASETDGEPAIPIRIYRPHRAGRTLLLYF